MMENENQTVLVVLAAGEASRMGKPKQVLAVHGVPLIDYQLARWRKVFSPPPVVITGAYAPAVRAMSRSGNVHWVHNHEWKSGLGSSIIKSVAYLEREFPEARACLLVLLDQVLIGPVHLLELLAEGARHPRSMIASVFDHATGPPVIFPREYWGDLLRLDPRKGAAPLFRKYPDAVHRVPLQGAAFDLDTPADYSVFLSRLGGSGRW